jgi:hypothetical protein
VMRYAHLAPEHLRYPKTARENRYGHNGKNIPCNET